MIAISKQSTRIPPEPTTVPMSSDLSDSVGF